jgi:hypothetical protein
MAWGSATHAPMHSLTTNNPNRRNPIMIRKKFDFAYRKNNPFQVGIFLLLCRIFPKNMWKHPAHETGSARTHSFGWHAHPKTSDLLRTAKAVGFSLHLAWQSTSIHDGFVQA